MARWGWVLVGLGGCGGAGGGPGNADGPPIHLTMSIRVEGSANDDTVKATFDAHGARLVSAADALDAHGAKGTFEVNSDYLGGMTAFGPELLTGLVARGHGTGLYADMRPDADHKGVKTAVGKMILDLDAMSLAARHASGVCTSGDWVGALNDIGIEAATGLGAWCARSLDPLPAEYAAVTSCTAGGSCAQPVPAELAARVVPWRADDGAAWLTPAAEGVWMLPTEGSMTCLAENAGGGSDQSCDLAADDTATFLGQLDAAIALSADDPEGPMRWMGLTWSIGEDVDAAALDAFLAGIATRVDAGQAQWHTVPGALDRLNPE